MEEKLDFSLPEKKRKGSVTNIISILLLLLIVLLMLLNLRAGRPSRVSAPEKTGQELSPDQTKQLATKLAQRNLYHQAARIWQNYLATAKLPKIERAKVLFQVGTLLEKAGLYAEAIEYYYRSELAAKIDEFESDINAHIKNCFEQLGKFSALRYELIDRTSYKTTDRTGSKVVAEIGAEKITEADLDAIIESNIENQLTPLSAFMTDEQIKQQKQKLLQQYKAPQAKQQFLQNYLAEEILYRQALQENLTEKPEIKRLLTDVSRSVLSQQLMNEQLALKINITETDLQTYYTANKEKYIEPARARISHILVSDEQLAKDLIKRIKDGEDFAELAKEFSEDQDTKDKAGKIETDVTKGSYVPVIGEAGKLNEKIFQASPPGVLDEPYKSEKGWEIINVEEKQEQRQKTFDEVGQQVASELLNQKRQDIQRDFIDQMMDKYNVVIHTSVLIPTQQNESDEESANKQK
jgi:parvulin-like peptidyl-prolyl isomerase